MNDFSVSVVIPAYRAAQTIRRALDSVIAQTRPADEIIVVDDGSPDDIAAALAPYGDRVKCVRKANGGAASARNAGIDVATGDFVAFLDADDYWKADKLERQVAVLRKHPEVGLIAGGFTIDIPGNPRPGGTPPREGWQNRVLTLRGAEAFQIAMLVWTGVVMVRRQLLMQERFTLDLQTAEDRDLWVRLVVQTNTYLLSEPLATHVLEPRSLSRSDPNRDCRNMMRVIERNRAHLGFWAHRQWKAHIYYRWSIGGDNVTAALARMLQSLFVWPFPLKAVDPDCGRALPRLQRLAYLTTALFCARQL